jgi:hypothetical protein
MPSIWPSVFERSFSQEWEKFSEPQSLEKQIQLFKSPAFFYENYLTEFEVPWSSCDLVTGEIANPAMIHCNETQQARQILRPFIG